jgi:broad specificity phosphatase PhoE
MNPTAVQAPAALCTLILVRHAHTDMAGRFCGHSDPPLSAKGLAQLSDLNQRLSTGSLTHIFSSDLQRTRRTAESIAQRCNLKIQLLSSLREFAFGTWEGLDWDQVVALDPDYAQRWVDLYPSVPAPGGEHFSDFRQRIQDAMNDISVQVQDGCAVVVTHAGVIRTFLGDLAGLQHSPADFSKFDYTFCWEVWREAGKWSQPQGSSQHGDVK